MFCCFLHNKQHKNKSAGNDVYFPPICPSTAIGPKHVKRCINIISECARVVSPCRGAQTEAVDVNDVKAAVQSGEGWGRSGGTRMLMLPMENRKLR